MSPASGLMYRVHMPRTVRALAGRREARGGAGRQAARMLAAWQRVTSPTQARQRAALDWVLPLGFDRRMSAASDTRPWPISWTAVRCTSEPDLRWWQGQREVHPLRDYARPTTAPAGGELVLSTQTGSTCCLLGGYKAAIKTRGRLSSRPLACAKRDAERPQHRAPKPVVLAPSGPAAPGQGTCCSAGCSVCGIAAF